MWGNLTSIYNRYRYLFYGFFLLTVILPVSNCSYKQRSAERKRTELEETINTFFLTSSLKKYQYYNWLINSIL